MASGLRTFLAAMPWLLALGLLAASPRPTLAQPAPAPLTEEQRRTEIQAAWSAAIAAGQRAPARVALQDQAVLTVPPEMVFVPSAEAIRLLRAVGNTPSPRTAGLVVSETEDWWVVVRFINEGYVKDDDAKDWNAADLLASLKKGNEKSNKDRLARGFPPVEIIGWLAPPSYDAATHRLVWSLESKTASSRASSNVNYNTYALGRDGYFSLNLLTTAESLPADRAVATALLGNLVYVEGKRYADFNASTDRVAEYGLAALVGAVAAKKLGLFAVLAAFAAKFAKVGLLAILGIGTAIAKLFGGCKPPAA